MSRNRMTLIGYSMQNNYSKNWKWEVYIIIIVKNVGIMKIIVRDSRKEFKLWRSRSFIRLKSRPLIICRMKIIYKKKNNKNKNNKYKQRNSSNKMIIKVIKAIIC